MAISRAKKVEVLEKLKQALESAKTLVFLNFKGLTVGDATQIRKTLKAEGVSYMVAKKTLARRALGEAKFSGEVPDLPGEFALAWGGDSIAPARSTYSFQTKLPENLKIVGGVFDGRFMNAPEMTEIARIPTLEVLRGKFVNIINSPIQRFVIGLNEISKQK